MKSKVPKSPKPAVDPGDQVDAFTARLKHPLKPEIEAVRQILVDAAPGITEEIKWNAPGFRTTESFATVNLRSLDRLQLIFHLGAKVRDPLPVMKVADPAGLMKWLAKDRCMVTAGTGKDIPANQSALQAVVQAWIKYV